MHTYTPGEDDGLNLLENREGFSEEVWVRSWEEYDSGEMLTVWGGQCLEMGLGGRLDWYPLQTLVHLRSKQTVVTDLYLEVYIQVDLSVQAYV